MNWNGTYRERSVQHAFKAAGVLKKHCRVHIDADHARICVASSLGDVPMEAMRKLVYRIDLFTGDRSVLVTEGRRQMPRIFIDATPS